jgi:hypothetical protein
MRESMDSSETLFYTAPAVTLFDSIIITNLTKKDIFIDFRLLGERIRPDGDSPVVEKPWVAYKRLVPPYSTIELMPSAHSVLTLEAGDFAYLNSDCSGNRFSYIISARQLLETSI